MSGCDWEFPYTQSGDLPTPKRARSPNLRIMVTTSQNAVMGARVSGSPDPEVSGHGGDAAQLRDNVLAIVAHDLKTPLATIVMAAGLLKDMSTDERVGHFLDMIVKSTHQIDVLIRDLVDVAAIEAGHLRIQREPEGLGHLLRSVSAMFETQAAQAGVLFLVEPDRVRDVVVNVDHDRVIQLLANLVSNAIKFTSAGGAVDLRADFLGDKVDITVRDTGVGIQRDELPHVFERFWQADHHHRAGAGLGLAIAKGIAEAHGGDISVSSELGLGTTFCVSLPLDAQ